MNEINYQMLELISDEYCLGKSDGLQLLIMKKNGHANATRLCKNYNKNFNHWLDNEESIQIINEFINLTGLSYNNIIIPEKDGKYVHKNIIPYIALWLSLSCAIKVNKIIDEYQDDKIREFEEQVCELSDKVTKLTLKVDMTIEDRVVKPNNTDLLNMVVIYQKNNKQFYIIRGQRLYVEKALEKYLTSNPHSTEFAKFDYNPNGINYYVRLKEKLKGKVTWRYNNFTLMTINSEELKDYIHQVDAERYVFN